MSSCENMYTCKCIRRQSDFNRIGGSYQYSGFGRTKYKYNEWVEPHICNYCKQKYGEFFTHYLREKTRNHKLFYRGYFDPNEIPIDLRWDNYQVEYGYVEYVRIENIRKIDENFSIGRTITDQNKAKKIIFWHDSPNLMLDIANLGNYVDIPESFKLNEYKSWLLNFKKNMCNPDGSLNKDQQILNSDGTPLVCISYFEWLDKYHKKEANIQRIIYFWKTGLFSVAKFVSYFI